MPSERAGWTWFCPASATTRTTTSATTRATTKATTRATTRATMRATTGWNESDYKSDYERDYEQTTVLAQQARWMDTVTPCDPFDMPFSPRLDNFGFVWPSECAGWTTASDPARVLDGHGFCPASALDGHGHAQRPLRYALQPSTRQPRLKTCGHRATHWATENRQKWHRVADHVSVVFLSVTVAPKVAKHTQQACWRDTVCPASALDGHGFAQRARWMDDGLLGRVPWMGTITRMTTRTTTNRQFSSSDVDFVTASILK